MEPELTYSAHPKPGFLGPWHLFFLAGHGLGRRPACLSLHQWIFFPISVLWARQASRFFAFPNVPLGRLEATRPVFSCGLELQCTEREMLLCSFSYCLPFLTQALIASSSLTPGHTDPTPHQFPLLSKLGGGGSTHFHAAVSL